jgi:outer membrane protein OmpA-like peptidoglycan-associated protein
VRIDEYDSVEALPVLNQIFFAEGSSRIPERYRLLDREGATVFTRDLLTGSALDVYYHMLNLIGKRLQEIPSATLTLNGYRNSRESDPRLGAMRAESIRRYLVDVWRIPQRRIMVRGGALPPNPARENAEEGFEENARVEILSSDPNITKPHYRRHIQRVANPPGVTFYPRAVAEAGVGEWEVEVSQEGAPWKSFAGTGALPDSIVWDWRGDRRELPHLPMRLSYRLKVVDSIGQVRTTESTPIAVNYRSVGQKMEHRVNDTTINIYSLLLFNYDSPRLSPGDQELINAITGTSDVTPRSIIRFTGYTDSLGDEEHNRQLANTRAAEAARLFKATGPQGVSIIVNQEGGELERFPYTTPEGRSHDRTVIIEIRTPVEVKKDGSEGDS